jgi:hypothetical protein
MMREQPDEWRALSLRAIWLEQVLDEVFPKEVENREGPLRWKGPFILHQAATLHVDDIDAYDQAITVFGRELEVGGVDVAKEMRDRALAHRADYLRGTRKLPAGFCGVARVVASIERGEEAPGELGWGINIRTPPAWLVRAIRNFETGREWDPRWRLRSKNPKGGPPPLQFAMLLADAKRLPFVPARGALGFFPVSPDHVRGLGLPPKPSEYRP